MRTFQSLSEQEILALAISLEEEDARIYDDFAEGLRDDYPATADTLKEMRAEEDGHRHRLLTLYRQNFGEHIPLIRRNDVNGFVPRKPIWLVRPLGMSSRQECVGCVLSADSSACRRPQGAGGDGAEDCGACVPDVEVRPGIRASK